QELGDEAGVVSALNATGIVAVRNRDDLAAARRVLEEAVQRERARVGDSELLVSCVINRGMVEHTHALDDMMTIAREEGVIDRGMVKRVREAWGAAVAWDEEAVAIEERLSGVVRNPHLLGNLADALEG